MFDSNINNNMLFNIIVININDNVIRCCLYVVYYKYLLKNYKKSSLINNNN